MQLWQCNGGRWALGASESIVTGCWRIPGRWKSSGCEVGDEVTACVCAMLAALDVHHDPRGSPDLCRAELSWSVGFLNSELESSVCLGLCNAPLNHQSLVNQTQGPAPEGFVGCRLNPAMTGECLGFSMASVQVTFFFFFFP